MWLIKIVCTKQISFGYLSPLKTAIVLVWNGDIVTCKRIDAPTHLKPGKYKLITEAGPTALFFILLLINLSVSPSSLLSTDNKEAKHFSLCFMSLSCTQSRHCFSDVFLFSPTKKGFDFQNRTRVIIFCSEWRPNMQTYFLLYCSFDVLIKLWVSEGKCQEHVFGLERFFIS